LTLRLGGLILGIFLREIVSEKCRLNKYQPYFAIDKDNSDENVINESEGTNSS